MDTEQTTDPQVTEESVTTPQKGFVANESDIIDGKYKGKWSSPDEMATHIKNMEDKYAALNREITDNKKKSETEAQVRAQQAEQQTIRNQTIMELAPEFVQTGKITPEMMERLTAVGLSEVEIKAGAYEVEKAVNLHASYVGGKENYDAIMNYHAQTMSDEDKIAFNNAIKDPSLSKATIVGLKALYEQASDASDTTGVDSDRVRGTIAQGSLKPYANKAEIFAARRAISTARSNRGALQEEYEKRIKITNENIYL